MNDLSPIKIKLDASTKDLAPVAQNLIKRVSSAIGLFYQPIKAKREAAAIVEIVRKFGEIDEAKISPLQRRALERFFTEEVENQKNIEKITSDSLEFLEDEAQPESISEDWLRYFYNKAKYISAEEVSILWSKILAGEANSPGSFSKRTLNILFELSTQEAQLFTKLAKYTVNMKGETVQPLIFNFEDEFYKEINFGDLMILENAGLIDFNSITGFKRHALPDNLVCFYGNNKINLDKKEGCQNEIDVGKCVYTEAGEQLYRTITIEPKESFLDYIVTKFSANYNANLH